METESTLPNSINPNDVILGREKGLLSPIFDPFGRAIVTALAPLGGVTGVTGAVVSDGKKRASSDSDTDSSSVASDATEPLHSDSDTDKLVGVVSDTTGTVSAVVDADKLTEEEKLATGTHETHELVVDGDKET